MKEKYHMSQEQLENQYVLPDAENIETYKKSIEESISKIIHPEHGETTDELRLK